MSRALALAAALTLVASCGGCVVYGTATQGVELDPEAVASLEKGKTTLPQVLERLGAPHEVHQHADGRVLVYRHRARNGFRLEISLLGQTSQILGGAVSNVALEALQNLSLTFERVHAAEDRLVILLDRRDVVLGVGLRMGTRDLPIW